MCPISSTFLKVSVITSIKELCILNVCKYNVIKQSKYILILCNVESPILLPVLKVSNLEGPNIQNSTAETWVQSDAGGWRFRVKVFQDCLDLWHFLAA